jgi:hypothetical protein
MKHGKSFFILALCAVLLVQAACNLPRASKPDAAATLNALYTQSAQTLEAMATQSALTSLASPTGAIATSSPIPGFNTPTTIPPIKTNTPVTRGDWAGFVADITYPDGSVVGRDTSFTKVWRLKNIGTNTWTTSYALVFVDGDAMNAPTAIGLPTAVAPGQTIDLQVTLTTPNRDGRYKGYFKLRNTSGMLFGVGDSAATAFWVDVKVAGTNFTAYDFVSNYCDAQWSNNKNALPCPGTDGDNQGYVVKLDAPKLENGDPAGSPGLITYPRDIEDGIIKGIYPPVKIQEGDRFRTVINCRTNSAGCNVIFRLDYQVANGAISNLGQWNEIYEGLSYAIDLDLSELAGYNVKFILSVSANGSPAKDFALWIGPLILRQGTPPPTIAPTFTFTPTATATGTGTATPSSTPSPTATATPTATKAGP